MQKFCFYLLCHMLTKKSLQEKNIPKLCHSSPFGSWMEEGENSPSPLKKTLFVCLRAVIKTDTHHTFPLQTGHKKDRIFLFVVVGKRLGNEKSSFPRTRPQCFFCYKVRKLQSELFFGWASQRVINFLNTCLTIK